MIIEHPQLAHIMKIAFMSLWDRGEPLEEVSRHLGYRGSISVLHTFRTRLETNRAVRLQAYCTIALGLVR